MFTNGLNTYSPYLFNDSIIEEKLINRGLLVAMKLKCYINNDRFQPQSCKKIKKHCLPSFCLLNVLLLVNLITFVQSKVLFLVSIGFPSIFIGFNE